jgi:hypothetical protein
VGGAVVLLALGGAIGGWLLHRPAVDANGPANQATSAASVAVETDPDNSSALDELRSTDPSPAHKSRAELDALSDMLDALEATPYLEDLGRPSAADPILPPIPSEE